MRHLPLRGRQTDRGRLRQSGGNQPGENHPGRDRHLQSRALSLTEVEWQEAEDDRRQAELTGDSGAEQQNGASIFEAAPELALLSLVELHGIEHYD